MSFYKNIQAFTLNTNIDISKLKDLSLIKECGPYDLESIGWSSILNDGELVYSASGALLVQLQIDKKQIPSSLIRKKVTERVQKLKEQGQGKVDKKEVTEEIRKELAKNAHVNSSYINAYIDNKNKYLVIDSSSAKSVDLFIEYLRIALDDELDIDIIEPNFNVIELLTSWLVEKTAPEPFEIEDSCVLTDLAEGSSTTYKKQDLSSEEIDQNLGMGKVVNSLKINWHERLSFNLTGDFKIKGIKASSDVNEAISQSLGEDDSVQAVFAASMIIMVEDFAELLEDLKKQGSK